ncbi:amidohydrolase family protein [Sphingomonas sp. RP10(2022)]|uniref:Amidohydrolase family protein n=1 Tax=Sphingomonas liriopis TaxID=2949094 RepID=A0A9X2HT60_9SPHN|nr:amidohydrolase family protein [Sphingomonas liriopis]MCP3736097.1 amidohydrolase family protein [Sphingomonas liriopis]
MTVPFVDAHVHLWDLSHVRYPWLTPPFSGDGPNGSAEGIARDYDVVAYRAELARWNLVGAVHIDAGAHPDDALRETAWLERQAEATGLPSGIVAFAALDAPDADAALAAQAAHPRVRGIRQIVNWHADAQRSYTDRDVTQDPRWQAGFAALGRHGLSFDLQCYPGQMPALAALFARHPEVPVIVNHLGMPVMSDADGLADWRRGMAALAALPQVAVKLSGLGFIWRDWTAERVRPLLLETIDLFGTHRAMVASDAPTDRLFAPIDRYMETYYALTADLSEDERRDLFGRNANRVYRLGLSV